MNYKYFKFLAAWLVILFVAGSTHAQVIFDDFSNGSINSGNWTVSTPFGDSSVTESGGNATFNNRGRLVSTATLPSDFTLLGRFSFTGSAFDHFRIVMFTDGVQALSSGEFNGLTLQFFMQSDGGGASNNVNLEEANFPSAAPTIDAATIPISLNTFYDFKLTKSGSVVSVYVTDMATPVFSTTTTFTSVGPYLALYNREGAAAGSGISAGSQVKLDYISVIPEPNAFGFAFVGSAFGYALYRKKQK